MNGKTIQPAPGHEEFFGLSGHCDLRQKPFVFMHSYEKASAGPILRKENSFFHFLLSQPHVKKYDNSFIVTLLQKYLTNFILSDTGFCVCAPPTEFLRQMEKNHLPQKAPIHASFPKKNAHFPPGNFYSRVRPPKQMPAAPLFQTVPGFLFSHQTFLFALYAAEFPLQSAIDVLEKPFRNVVAIYLPREHTTPSRPFPAGAHSLIPQGQPPVPETAPLSNRTGLPAIVRLPQGFRP